MKNYKKHKKFLVITTIFSLLVTTFGFMPNVKTAHAVDALTNARDLITDSDLNVLADHTFTFTTGTTTATNGYWDIEFPVAFTGVATASVECAYGAAGFTEQVLEGAASDGGDVVRCLYTGADQVGTSTQVTVANVLNPNSDGFHTIDIYHYKNATSLAERVQVMVYIIQDVLMTATVDSTLSFTVNAVNAGTVVNTVTCTATSTATTTPFGTLAPGASTTVCQELKVGTNASNGFSVTVEQSDELTSSGGDNINSFDNSPDNTGSSTAHAWVSPSGTLNQYHTYGHMGLTSQDSTLVSASDPYANGLYKGLNNTDPVEVFYHDKPSDGNAGGGDTEHIGSTKVAYTAEITALQEAGDYETTLTYIVTPVY